MGNAFGFIVGIALSAFETAEEPKFDVISTEDNIELRIYNPMIVAEVEVEGERRTAIDDGFRLVAGYIFGNNYMESREQDAGNQKIAMTSPVQQTENKKIAMTSPVQQTENKKIAMTSPVQQTEKKKIAMTSPVQQTENKKIAMTSPVQQTENKKIAMTSPVQQTENKKIAMTSPVQQTEKKIAMTSPVQQTENKKIAKTSPVQQRPHEKSWLVSFVMPSEYTMNDLPKPKDDRVRLKEIPPQKVAVIKFSGRNKTDNLERHEELLRDYMKQKELNAQGEAKFAFFDPPWKLPAYRRNEVQIEFTEDSDKVAKF